MPVPVSVLTIDTNLQKVSIVRTDTWRMVNDSLRSSVAKSNERGMLKHKHAGAGAGVMPVSVLTIDTNSQKVSIVRTDTWTFTISIKTNDNGEYQKY
jgi:hypothetical protein